MTGKTLWMNYEPSEESLHTDVRNAEISGAPHTTRYLHGERLVGGRFGTYFTASSSRLVLGIEVDGKTHEVWVEHDFRRALNIRNLTAKRQAAIVAAMPANVEVVRLVGRKGTVCYRLSPQALAAWAIRFRL